MRVSSRNTVRFGVVVLVALFAVLAVVPAASAIVATPGIRVNDNTPRFIADHSTVDVPFVVRGVTGAVEDVRVSFYLTHSWDGDLHISLIGPDGTTSVLSDRRGGSGDNFGTAASPDGSRATFDDAAGSPISAGSAPFVGTWRPDSPLSVFVGKSGSNVNGTWTLRVKDMAGGDVGTIHASSLMIDAPVDLIAPVISVPADMDVPATSASGASVTFEATANDDVDGSVDVTYWLDYGMWNQEQITSPFTFPHGVSTVTCVASDAAGNTATSVFEVRVSWSSAIGQVIDELTSLASTMRSSRDRANVNEAIAHLERALSHSLWSDGSHPAPGLFGGEIVFGECRAAVEDLRRCGAVSPMLREALSTLGSVCRGIATLQMDESEVAGGSPRKLRAARAALLRGDQWLNNNIASAIDWYKEAWRQALGAL